MSPQPTIPRTLVVTGHFPPEPGGVQTFTWELVSRLPADRVVVVAPAWPGDRDFDRGLPFPVARRHGYLLFAGLRRLVREHRLEVGWITALAPFGLYAPLVHASGVRRLVASSHGQELGWVRAWPTRLALRRMARSVDSLTYLTESTRSVLTGAGVHPPCWARLAGGVDIARFRPGLDGRWVRRRHRLGDGPVGLSVSRLVRRKGHDVLLSAWADVLRAVPAARLVIVGHGPMRRPLTERADRLHPGSVTVTGPVPPDELPAYYAAADLFVLPCRDDRAGLQAEGLGLSVLEASASGLPVVVGRSGGSAESLRPGETGLLIDARHPEAVAAAVLQLLAAPERAAAMGSAGRAWVSATWTWDAAARRLATVLREPCGSDATVDVASPPDGGRS